MRRNITYNRYIKLIFLVLFLIVYQAFTGVYSFLSPLVGVFFVYISNRFKYGGFDVYLAFLYLCFFELSHGFYLFSMAFLFIIFYYLIKPKIASAFEGESWTVALSVVIAYIGLYLVNVFFSYLLDRPLLNFSFIYFFYICIDIILANLLLRGSR
ncbi:MAG: hypothetical protein LBS39_00305 [Campylobacteraceae bacterium]|jgi:hypothetical protein|nr:hypothetical protein [Campylobacteraceae bacterium]